MLVRVAEVRALQIPALEDVHDGIRRSLLRQRAQALIDERYEAATIVPMLPLEGGDGGGS